MVKKNISGSGQNPSAGGPASIVIAFIASIQSEETPDLLRLLAGECNCVLRSAGSEARFIAQTSITTP